MAFIPIILNKLNLNSSEASIKYFLVQAFASLLIIFSRLMVSTYNQSYRFVNTFDIITLSLGIKTGIAPIHLWFPQVIELTE
jgi:NADH-ubiquinone oxidoreductase chain 2